MSALKAAYANFAVLQYSNSATATYANFAVLQYSNPVTVVHSNMFIPLAPSGNKGEREEGRRGRNKRQATPDPCFQFDHEVDDGKDHV